MEQILEKISTKLTLLVSDYQKIKSENKMLKSEIKSQQNTQDSNLKVKAIQKQIDGLIYEIDICLKDIKSEEK